MAPAVCTASLASCAAAPGSGCTSGGTGRLPRPLDVPAAAEVRQRSGIAAVGHPVPDPARLPNKPFLDRMVAVGRDLLPAKHLVANIVAAEATRRLVPCASADNPARVQDWPFGRHKQTVEWEPGLAKAVRWLLRLAFATLHLSASDPWELSVADCLAAVAGTAGSSSCSPSALLRMLAFVPSTRLLVLVNMECGLVSEGCEACSTKGCWGIWVEKVWPMDSKRTLSRLDLKSTSSMCLSPYPWNPG